MQRNNVSVKGVANGKEYAVYFTNGGEVTLDIGALKKLATVQWLDIMKCHGRLPNALKAGAS